MLGSRHVLPVLDVFVREGMALRGLNRDLAIVLKLQTASLCRRRTVMGSK